MFVNNNESNTIIKYIVYIFNFLLLKLFFKSNGKRVLSKITPKFTSNFYDEEIGKNNDFYEESEDSRLNCPIQINPIYKIKID